MTERYVLVARESGAHPVLVFNKADRCAEPGAVLSGVAALPDDIERHVVSALAGDGLPALASYLDGGRTIALLGPSGVGKSTLTNALTDTRRQATGDVRADGRGRHTTTRRELIVVPGRGLILDTPGLRELQLWSGDPDTAFTDIAAIASGCRFADCAHVAEPGCAIRAAAVDGTLDPERADAQRKLERELAVLELRKDARAMTDRRRRWRVVNRHPKRPRGRL